MELGVEIGKLLVAFLVLINPFSALSIYLDLTQNHSTKEKRRIARTAALAVFIVIVVFALGGGILLKVLGISVGSFQVGGGILVLLIAISLMNGNDNPAKPKIDPNSEEHHHEQQVRRNEKSHCRRPPLPFRLPSAPAVSLPSLFTPLPPKTTAILP